VAMTIISLVVEINSEDFNVACILSSVDRQLDRGGSSFQISAENLVLPNGGDTSCLDIDSAGKSRSGSSPVTVDDFSEGCVRNSVGAD